ncbi:hypothetical protein AGOR_G00033120 [Albula goreensis]|uniref:Uncharacterized protein n=1 Tax=Albula goreensis TaxID=1534307 RepID=A0A8T3DW59_9TELE|nr:hypothetical protein AGOR_G00033120 [Albula goreensis]
MEWGRDPCPPTDPHSKVTPSTASSRRPTLKAPLSSRVTPLSSSLSTQGNRDTQASSRHTGHLKDPLVSTPTTPRLRGNSMGATDRPSPAPLSPNNSSGPMAMTRASMEIISSEVSKRLVTLSLLLDGRIGCYRWSLLVGLETEETGFFFCYFIFLPLHSLHM